MLATDGSTLDDVPWHEIDRGWGLGHRFRKEAVISWDLTNKKMI
jgi:hypothetical protein